MEMSFLENRAQLLQAEIKKNQQNVNLLTEHLERAKLQLHMINGQLVEVGFLIQEQKKVKEGPLESSKEKSDGKTNS